MNAADVALGFEHAFVLGRAVGCVRPNVRVLIGVQDAFKLAAIMDIGACRLTASVKRCRISGPAVKVYGTALRRGIIHAKATKVHTSL